MGKHWTNKRGARAALAHELRDRGWTLSGYKADKSDSMTDLYDPADWSPGVAEKDGAKIVVDCSEYDVKSNSGRTLTKNVQVPTTVCDRCHASGKDPSGWTLEKARADPRAYHAWEIDAVHGPGSRIVNLMPTVVSPLRFNRPGGGLDCVKCHGHGCITQYRSEPIGVFPTFQANPPRRNWHIERNGAIVASGIGLFSAEEWGEKGKAATKALADRIEAAAFPKAVAAKPAAGTPTVGYAFAAPLVQDVPQITFDAGKVNVRFPAKPDQGVIDALKSAGFRWWRAGGSWYAKDTPEHRALADLIAQAGTPVPPREDGAAHA